MEIFSTTKSKNPFATEEVIKALNYRIEQEEYSSRIYHAMAMWLNDHGFMGATKAWQADADGEMQHAQWAKDYLLDMGVQPTIPALPKPPQSFTGLPDIIRQSFKHEVMVTEQCNELAKKAMKSGDHLLYQLANRFLVEQQEELGRTQTMMDWLDSFGETKDVLLILDKKIGKLA